MARVFLTGASGFLGHNILDTLAQKHELFGTFYGNEIQHPKSVTQKVNICDRDQVKKAIRAHHPDAIVHVAALSDVDACERNPEKARKINLQGTRNLIEAAQINNSYFLYISTDAVFDGNEGPYSEESEVAPINVYAETKVAAEKEVQMYGNGLVARTNFYGWSRGGQSESLAEWILNGLEKKARLTLFQDVYFSPVYAPQLGKVLNQLLRKQLNGILHLPAPDNCSKLEFGHYIAEVFDLNPDPIVSISVDEKDFDAERPKNTTLVSNRLEEEVQSLIDPIRDGLFEMKQDRRKNKI